MAAMKKSRNEEAMRGRIVSSNGCQGDAAHYDGGGVNDT